MIDAFNTEERMTSIFAKHCLEAYKTGGAGGPEKFKKGLKKELYEEFVGEDKNPSLSVNATGVGMGTGIAATMHAGIQYLLTGTPISVEHLAYYLAMGGFLYDGAREKMTGSGAVAYALAVSPQLFEIGQHLLENGSLENCDAPGPLLAKTMLASAGYLLGKAYDLNRKRKFKKVVDSLDQYLDFE